MNKIGDIIQEPTNNIEKTGHVIISADTLEQAETVFEKVKIRFDLLVTNSILFPKKKFNKMPDYVLEKKYAGFVKFVTEPIVLPGFLGWALWEKCLLFKTISMHYGNIRFFLNIFENILRLR